MAIMSLQGCLRNACLQHSFTAPTIWPGIGAIPVNKQIKEQQLYAVLLVDLIKLKRTD